MSRPYSRRTGRSARKARRSLQLCRANQRYAALCEHWCSKVKVSCLEDPAFYLELSSHFNERGNRAKEHAAFDAHIYRVRWIRVTEDLIRLHR